MRYLSVVIFLINQAFAANNCSNLKSLNHTKLWGKKPIKNQCDVGSCHSFAAIGLVEAKLKQHHDVELDLSEQDIFLRYYLEDGLQNRIKENLEDTVERAKDGSKFKKTINEGGWASEDFEKIKDEGVLLEKTEPYELAYGGDTYKALKKLREESKDLHEDIVDCKKKNTLTYPKIEKLYEDTSNILLSSDIGSELRVQNNYGAKKEREYTKDLLKDIHMETYSWGIDDKNKLHSLLKCQPVGISVKGYGKIKNGKPAGEHESGHALIIAGYDCEKDQFIMKNSWGGGFEKVDANLLAKGTYGAQVLYSDRVYKNASGCEDDSYKVIPGDINLDGVVDVQDYDMITRMGSEYYIPKSDKQYMSADFNRDGKIDKQDAQKIHDIVYKEVPVTLFGYEMYKDNMDQPEAYTVKKSSFKRSSIKFDPLSISNSTSISEHLEKKLDFVEFTALESSFRRTIKNLYENKYITKAQHEDYLKQMTERSDQNIVTNSIINIFK